MVPASPRQSGGTNWVTFMARNAHWMRIVLLVAAGYNILWGTVVVWLPKVTLDQVGLDNSATMLWQCIGMMVGVYGIGYAIAAWDPLRHWPITLVGLLGKTLGPIGYITGVIMGELPRRIGWTILTNDLIWWVPFAMILRRAWKDSHRFHKN